MKPRVLVADASPLVRLAIRSALQAGGIDQLRDAASAQDALVQTADLKPDAVLLDLELDPQMVVASQIAAALDGGALLILTGGDPQRTALAAVRAGACGLLPKSMPPARLPDVIRGVLAGEAAFPRSVTRSLLAQLRHEPGARRPAGHAAANRLTAREREVLDLLASGHRDERIAASLGVSPITVRRHVATARHKLRAAGRSEALARYQQVGA